MKHSNARFAAPAHSPGRVRATSPMRLHSRPLSRSIHWVWVLLVGLSLAACGSAEPGPAQPSEPGWKTFRDSTLGVAIDYPRGFGRLEPSWRGPGCALALRFPFSPEKDTAGIFQFTGTLMVTEGPPQATFTAVGGLYDYTMSGGVYEEDLIRRVWHALPRLTPLRFCEQIRREAHLEPVPRPLRDLPDSTVEDLREFDRFGHIAPKVRFCTVEGSTVTFDEIVTLEPGDPEPTHTYGVIRFLSGRFSSVQFIQGGQRKPPTAEQLALMRRMVDSFRVQSQP